MANVTVFCFLASYLVVFGLEWKRLVGRAVSRRAATWRAIMIATGLAGLFAHTMYLINRSRQIDLPPLLGSSHDWLLVLAWLAILLYLYLTIVDRDLAIGLFLLPLVLLLIGAAYFVSDVPSAHVVQDGNALRDAFYYWAMLHASLLVIGIAGVVVGFVLSMMYLAQHRRLKHKQSMRRGLALPSLARIARLNWWAVVISVPLLTLGMATGVGLGVYSTKGPNPITFVDPVVIVNGLVWVLMVAFYCWLMFTRRPAGTQVAWLTIWAFGFLLVTLIGLQVFTDSGASSVHRRPAHGLLLGPSPGLADENRRDS